MEKRDEPRNKRERSGNKSVVERSEVVSGAPLCSHRDRNGILSREDFRVNFLASARSCVMRDGY